MDQRQKGIQERSALHSRPVNWSTHHLLPLSPLPPLPSLHSIPSPSCSLNMKVTTVVQLGQVGILLWAVTLAVRAAGPWVDGTSLYWHQQ